MVIRRRATRDTDRHRQTPRRIDRYVETEGEKSGLQTDRPRKKQTDGQMMWETD